MHTVSPGCEGDIGPPIHQYPGGSRLGQVHEASGQIEKLPVREILLADLNKIHASADDTPNGGQE